VVLVEEFTRRPISETRNHSVLAANRRYAYLDPVLPTVVNQGNCLVVLLDAIYCHTSLATARRCLPDGEGVDCLPITVYVIIASGDLAWCRAIPWQRPLPQPFARIATVMSRVTYTSPSPARRPCVVLGALPPLPPVRYFHQTIHRGVRTDSSP
jgi:hypothetical protein